jgi:MraZ protein
MTSPKFRGTSHHTLDDRGRIVLPKKYRERLKGNLIMFYWMEESIVVLPPEAQENWEEELLSRVPIYTREGRNFERMFRAFSFDEIEMDKQGRVPIPASLREKVGLGREAVLVGVGNHLEIWDRKRWDDMIEAETPQYAENCEASLMHRMRGKED